MPSASAQPFSIGKIISQGVSILSVNLVPFGIISVAVTVPSFAYGVLASTPAVATHAEITDGGVYIGRSIVGTGALITVALQFVLRQIAVGTISYGVFQEMQGRRPSFGECLSRAVSVVVPVLAVAVVVTVPVVIGALLLLVPGMILMTMLWVAIPVAVVERPGVFRSLSRSAVLTRGHRWQIFGLFLLIIVAYYAVTYLVEVMFGGNPRALVLWLVEALFSAFTAVVTAVSYCTLRLAKEGVGIEEIASVFD